MGPLPDTHIDLDFRLFGEEEDEEDVEIDGISDEEEDPIAKIKTTKSKDEKGIGFLGMHIPQVCSQLRDEDSGSGSLQPVWEFDPSNVEDHIGCSIIDRIYVINPGTPLTNTLAQGSFFQVNVPP